MTKNIEQCKAEDLGCQVQDANPGNFGIEQEVAAMVGATVPAPTEPDDDDARELPAQLLVFLRRALTPIQSALRTALAAIYAHLDSRCTDYTPAAYDPFMLHAGPYDPMRPFVPRTLPNLLQAITAFSPRKISNGSAPNDGIPDGVSLARLLCADYADVVELKDDNPAYGDVTFGDTQRLFTIFPNIETLQLNIRKLTYSVSAAFSSSKLKVLRLPYLEVYDGYGAPSGSTSAIVYGTQVEELDLSALKEINRIAANKSNPPQIANSCTNLKTVDLSGVTSFFTSMDGGYPATYFLNCQNIEHIKIGRPTSFSSATITQYASGSPMLNLIDLEFGQGTNINLDLRYWNPTDKGTTFLQNFKEHIALRLTDQGSGKTLTLHRDVVDAIDAAEATYGIRHIICNQKGWTISPAPTA